MCHTQYNIIQQQKDIPRKPRHDPPPVHNVVAMAQGRVEMGGTGRIVKAHLRMTGLEFVVQIRVYWRSQSRTLPPCLEPDMTVSKNINRVEDDEVIDLSN